MQHKKRSFFERLTGSINIKEEHDEPDKNSMEAGKKNDRNWIEQENDEAELTVDVYQTPTDIIIQTMVAGVKPEDIELSIARDIMTIHGVREENRSVDEEKIFTGESFPAQYRSPMRWNRKKLKRQKNTASLL